MPHDDASETRSQTANMVNIVTLLHPLRSDISSGRGAAWLGWRWKAFVRGWLAFLGVQCDSLRRCSGAVTLVDVCPQSLLAVSCSAWRYSGVLAQAQVQDHAAISLIQSDLGEKDSREDREIDWSARLSGEGFHKCLNAIFQTSMTGRPDASQGPIHQHSCVAGQ